MNTNSLRCYFGIHKWNYYLPMKNYRYCDRCFKQQIQKKVVIRWEDKK